MCMSCVCRNVDMSSYGRRRLQTSVSHLSLGQWKGSKKKNGREKEEMWRKFCPEKDAFELSFVDENCFFFQDLLLCGPIARKAERWQSCWFRRSYKTQSFVVVVFPFLLSSFSMSETELMNSEIWSVPCFDLKAGAKFTKCQLQATTFIDIKDAFLFSAFAAPTYAFQKGPGNVHMIMVSVWQVRFGPSQLI